MEWPEVFHCLSRCKSYGLHKVNHCLDRLILRTTLTHPKLIPPGDRSNLIASSQPRWPKNGQPNPIHYDQTIPEDWSNIFSLSWFTLILFSTKLLCNQMLSKASRSRRYVLVSRRMRRVITRQLWQSEGWASELWGAPVCLFISRCCQQEAERSFTSIRQICSALSTRQPGKPDGKEW